MILLMLSGILLLLVNSIQMFVYIMERNTTDWCTWLGFVYQLALDTIVMVTIIIEFYLAPVKNQKSHFILAAFVGVVVEYSLSYVPILQGCYGDSGAWCWISIRPKHGPNCKIVNSAFYQQMFIWYAKIGLVLFFGIVLLCIHHRRPKTKFIVMLWHYFISFSIANGSGLINRVVTWSIGHPLLPLQILQVIAFTWWPVITALPLILSEQQLEKLGWKMQWNRS